MPHERTKSNDPAIQLKFRIDGGLRKQLDEAARQRGVSLSKEITNRLENSFGGGLDYVSPDRLAQGAFAQYGRIGPLLQLAAETMLLVGQQASAYSGAQEWFDDPYAYDQTVKAAVSILSRARPEGDAEVPAHLQKPRGALSAEGRALFLKNLHDVIAEGVLEHLSQGNLGVIDSRRRARNLVADLQEMIKAKRLKLPDNNGAGRS